MALAHVAHPALQESQATVAVFQNFPSPQLQSAVPAVASHTAQAPETSLYPEEQAVHAVAVALVQAAHPV